MQDIVRVYVNVAGKWVTLFVASDESMPKTAAVITKHLLLRYGDGWRLEDGWGTVDASTVPASLMGHLKHNALVPIILDGFVDT
jgi:hypothetical protein